MKLADNDIDLIANFETPLDGIHSIVYKENQKAAWIDWVADKRAWKSMLTLTFDDKKHQYDVSTTDAKNYWRMLVRQLNVGVFGEHYTKHCHHSYFSYVIGLEYQKRGVVHFHVLVDNYVNYELIHRLWGNAHGFVWISPVTDRAVVVEYVCKYIMKQGDANLDIYVSKKRTVPIYKPDWWIKAETAFEQRGFTGDSQR
jgi:hypothetical protein